MSNDLIGVIGGASLAILIFGWWGVVAVALLFLAAYAECKYPPAAPTRTPRFAIVSFVRQKRK